MSEYKLSIIIPTFNLEDKIGKAFESVKSQTIGFENIEVIFVDDSSTDGTLSILNWFSEKYANVKIFRTDQNSGYAGKPRNIGLLNSTADYVLFLDGDDELLINACEVLYDSIISHDCDIVIGGQINVFSDGVLQHNPPISFGEDKLFKNTLNPDLLKTRPAISSKLFRKFLLERNNIKFPENIPGQDLVFVIESLIKSGSVYVLNSFYVYYRNLFKDSITYDLNEKYFYGLIEAYAQVCDLFDANHVDLKIQEVVMHNHLSFFTSQILVVYYENDKNIDLNEICNSKEFLDFEKKPVFQNNKNFKTYFEYMKNKRYNNKDILNTIYEEFDFNSEIVSNLLYVKEELGRIRGSQYRIYEENKRLKKELDEIKSSKLWKLRNSFKKMRLTYRH